MLCFKPVILNEHQVSEAVPSAVAQIWLWSSLVKANKKNPWKCLGLIFGFLFRYGFVNLNTSSTLTHFSLVLHLKENKRYGPFLWMGFNCRKATDHFKEAVYFIQKPVICLSQFLYETQQWAEMGSIQVLWLIWKTFLPDWAIFVSLKLPCGKIIIKANQKDKQQYCVLTMGNFLEIIPRRRK